MSEDLISNQTDERDLAVTELPADEDAISENTEEQAAEQPVFDPQLTDVDPEKVSEPSYKSEEAYWYVVHTYSGYENKVKVTLDKIVENRGIQDYIQEVFIPMEEVVEIKDGKRKTSMKKIYPGYVMIKMVLTDEIWYIVRNTRGVTGFVGPNSRPVPLTEEELAIMGMVSDWVPVVDYDIGDTVKIINGPLENFNGRVENISHEKKKVSVLVSMFGRETPVELEFTQVIRI
jgi:transcriptional antiterminator NusG